MKQLFKILVAILVLIPAVSVAQQASSGSLVERKGSFLRPLQQRDSVLIADQLEYGFLLEGMPEGTGIGLADYSQGFMDSVELVRSWKLDTLKTYKAKKGSPASFDVEGSIVITSFDEGTYDLPRLAIAVMDVNGKVDTLLFDPQILDVKTMPVDTATYVLHDIKGQVRYPVTFSEILPYAAGVLVVAAIVAGIIYYIRERRKKILAEQIQEPAYIIALRKLDKFRGDKFWAPEKQKMFYSGITDAVREYMADRYQIDALEMTTAEIFSALKGSDIPRDLYLEMKTLFETADFVKFAKHVADDQENASAVPSAVRFITSTYQSVLDQEADSAQVQPQDDNSADKDGKDGSAEEKDYSAYMPK